MGRLEGPLAVPSARLCPKIAPWPLWLVWLVAMGFFVVLQFGALVTMSDT